jgi:TerB-C domain
LQALHWALLRALLQGDASSATLDAIARRGYTTANQLIDEINAAALDQLGDLVIDASGELPGIVAEAEEPLRRLLEELG